MPYNFQLHSDKKYLVVTKSSNATKPFADYLGFYFCRFAVVRNLYLLLGERPDVQVDEVADEGGVGHQPFDGSQVVCELEEKRCRKMTLTLLYFV